MDTKSLLKTAYLICRDQTLPSAEKDRLLKLINNSVRSNTICCVVEVSAITFVGYTALKTIAGMFDRFGNRPD